MSRVNKILDNRAPKYLSEIIKLYTPCRPANPVLRLLERQDNRSTTNTAGVLLMYAHRFFGMICLGF